MLVRTLRAYSCLDCPVTQTRGVQSMPDARGPPIIGAITSVIRAGGGSRLHEYIDEQHRKYGPIFRGQIGPVKSVYLSDPEAIRKTYKLEGPNPRIYVPDAWLRYNQLHNRVRGLLFMNGELWHRNRSILNKIMLNPDAFNLLSNPSYEAARNFAEQWKNYVKLPYVPDLELELCKFSLEVILALLTGPSWQRHRARLLPDLYAQSLELTRLFEYSMELARVPTRLAELLRLPAWRGFLRSADSCFEAIDRHVAWMSSLEDAEEGMMALMAKAGLDDVARRSIAVDFVMAAGHTTSYAIQWMLFLLASNPEKQEKIRDALSGLERTEIPHHPLLIGAIKETLRLYPVAPFISRYLPDDAYYGEYPVYKDELITFSLYTCGRNESCYPRVHEFLPERWLRNDKGELSGVLEARASLPFGMGQKSCIGRRLAMIEMAYFISEILKNFKIDCLNEKNISIKLRLITAPSEPLQLKLTPLY